MGKQLGSYLMCIFTSHPDDRIKKCHCGHQIFQKDLLQKIKSTCNGSDFYICYSCKREINYMII